MIAAPKNSFIMLVLLGVAIFTYNLGVDIFHALRLEPLPSFEFLYSVIFICGVIWWLRAEVQRSAVTKVYCPGVLVTAAWPFIIPYHLLKTRGVRGLLPLFALIGAFVSAKVLGVLIHVAIYLAFSRY